MEEILQLIRNGNTEAALDALESKRHTYPPHTQKAIVLLKAAWINLKNQQQMGVISTEEAGRIHNRINLGALDVGQDIASDGGGHNINLHGLHTDLHNEQTEKIVLQIEQATFHQVSGNQVQVGQADNVVVGSGNTITTKVNKGWGIVQYTLLILVISILGLGGWYAFQHIGNATDDILLSLSTIQADINALAGKDSAVKNAYNSTVQEELDKGWNALQSNDLNGAIVHLSKVAEVAPAPRLLLQLGLAYREYKQEIQAEQYILKAFEADPGLKQEYIRTLRGQRINLLNITNGGSLVKASDGGMEQLLHHFNAYSGIFPCEAVFAFGDRMPATFDLFQVYVKETHGYNARHFELSVADAPTGPFKIIKSFETENAFLSGGFQDFSFPPVTARYLKMKMLDTHGKSNFGWVGDIRLMGMLTD